MNAPAYRLDELEFEPVPHRYIVRGKEIVSVTTHERENGIGFQGFAPQSALDRGNYVHEASLLVDQDDLDWEAVPKEYLGYLTAYDLAMRENPGKVIAAEKRLYHPDWWYAGTLDRAMLIIKKGKRIIRELKTGDTSDVDVQVAAYTRAYNYWFPNAPVDEHVGECLKVNDDGTYRLFDLDLDEGWIDFTCCLRLSARRRRNGNRRRS